MGVFEDIERDIRQGKSEEEVLAGLKTRGLSEVNAKRFFDRSQAAVAKSPSPSPSATSRFRVGRFLEDGASDAYRLAVDALRNSEEVEARVGTPLETGLPMGSISTQGSGGGRAEINFRVSGPKGEVRALALATRHGGVWRLRGLALLDPQTKEVTRIEIPDPGGETQ